jgi:Cse1
LLGICQNVAIPNLLIRESDEELFEENPVSLRGSSGVCVVLACDLFRTPGRLYPARH